MTTSGTRAAADDAVEDLDGVPACSPGDRRPPRRTGRRAAAAALLVAALVVVLAGGVAAHRGRDGDALAAGSRSGPRLQVSIPTGAVRSPGVPWAGGWSLYQVAIPVINLGPRPVSVTVLGLDAPYQRTAAVPAPVEVEAGTATTVMLLLKVRCGDVPAPGRPLPAPGRTARRAAVLARVDAPGGSGGVRVRLPWERDGAGSFTQQLWSVCVPRVV